MLMGGIRDTENGTSMLEGQSAIQLIEGVGAPERT